MEGCCSTVFAALPGLPTSPSYYDHSDRHAINHQVHCASHCLHCNHNSLDLKELLAHEKTHSEKTQNGFKNMSTMRGYLSLMSARVNNRSSRTPRSQPTSQPILNTDDNKFDRRRQQSVSGCDMAAVNIRPAVSPSTVKNSTEFFQVAHLPPGNLQK